MTIFVTWQLIVTLDSIRNSCDVYLVKSNLVNQVAVHSVRRALPGYKLEDLPERWFLSPPPLDSLFWITQIETIHSDGAQAELLSGYFAALLWCITTGTLSTRWVSGWGAVAIWLDGTFSWTNNNSYTLLNQANIWCQLVLVTRTKSVHVFVTLDLLLSLNKPSRLYYTIK